MGALNTNIVISNLNFPIASVSFLPSGSLAGFWRGPMKHSGDWKKVAENCTLDGYEEEERVKEKVLDMFEKYTVLS